MKISILYLVLIFTVCLSGAALAFSTTFAEYDQMTKDEQSTFISETGVTIFAWLKKNDPAKAQCMYDKFEIAEKLKRPSPPMIELEKKIKGVSEENRSQYHVESLMANYIVDDLCAVTNSQTASDERSTISVK